MMHDVVIIGGGHNSLVCSAYLAMAGLKVLVLDQRPVAGGAAVTEEFSPGFRNSVASYAVSLLNPKIIRELDLAVHGLRIVGRPIANFLPLGDGSFLKAGGSHTKREVAKFSARDAECLDDYQRRLSAVGNVLRASVLETPPNVVEGSPFAAITELLKAGRIANRIRSVGLDLQRDFLDLFAASAGDFLDSWFESAPIKAAFGFDSVVGNYASPYTSGSAYVLLHHSFGEVNGKRGVWGHAIGGMGAITQVMAKSATAHGVTIRLSTRVRRVLIENGQAIGVETDKGESVRAIAVAARINPKLLYLHLVEARALPEESGGRWKTGVAGLARFG
jgi:phytoene dehydrogenase-like protein